MTFTVNEAVLNQLLREGESKTYFAAIGREVRDRARANASGITDKTDAIISVPGEDSEGLFNDVGYSKHHPGFFLWWWEVGTTRHPPTPHLRPALRPHG